MIKNVVRLTLLVCLLFGSSVFGSEFNKSSVAPGASKAYGFVSLADGHVTVTVIYDKASADIDIGLGVGGELIAASLGQQRNFEQLKTGTLSGVVWVIVVLNNGSAKTNFRLIVEGAQAENVIKLGAMATDLHEARLVEKLKDYSKLFRKLSGQF